MTTNPTDSRRPGLPTHWLAIAFGLAVSVPVAERGGDFVWQVVVAVDLGVAAYVAWRLLPPGPQTLVTRVVRRIVSGAKRIWGWRRWWIGAAAAASVFVGIRCAYLNWRIERGIAELRAQGWSFDPAALKNPALPTGVRDISSESAARHQPDWMLEEVARLRAVLWSQEYQTDWMVEEVARLRAVLRSQELREENLAGQQRVLAETDLVRTYRWIAMNDAARTWENYRALHPFPTVRWTGRAPWDWLESFAAAAKWRLWNKPRELLTVVEFWAAEWSEPKDVSAEPARLAALKRLTELHRIVPGSYHRADESLTRLGRAIPMEPFALTYLPNQHALIAQQVAHLRAVECALAVERYRLRHGTWPESLDDLPREWRPTAPPTSGLSRPLTYRRTEHAIAIYDWGPNGRDDGGGLDWGRSCDDVGWCSTEANEPLSNRSFTFRRFGAMAPRRNAGDAIPTNAFRLILRPEVNDGQVTVRGESDLPPGTELIVGIVAIHDNQSGEKSFVRKAGPATVSLDDRGEFSWTSASWDSGSFHYVEAVVRSTLPDQLAHQKVGTFLGELTNTLPEPGSGSKAVAGSGISLFDGPRLRMTVRRRDSQLAHWTGWSIELGESNFPRPLARYAGKRSFMYEMGNVTRYGGGRFLLYEVANNTWPNRRAAWSQLSAEYCAARGASQILADALEPYVAGNGTFRPTTWRNYPALDLESKCDGTVLPNGTKLMSRSVRARAILADELLLVLTTEGTSLDPYWLEQFVDSLQNRDGVGTK